MTTLKQGDLIKDSDGDTYKVLETCGTILHISYSDDHARYNFTTDEANLKDDGFTWDTPVWKPEIKEVYWYIYINDTGAVDNSIWNDDEIDHARRDFLGIFKTRELGKAALLEIRRKLGK